MKPTKKFLKNEYAETNLVSLAVGLTIFMIVVGYVGSVGITAMYDVDTRGWGYGNVSGESYQWNDTSESWEWYNETGVWVNTTSREDVGSSSLFKLLPLFVGIVFVVAILYVVKRRE